jgi:hypothetical protein
VPPSSVCAQLRAQRALVNAQLDAVAAANPSASAAVATYRNAFNSRIDAELAARGCNNGT